MLEEKDMLYASKQHLRRKRRQQSLRHGLDSIDMNILSLRRQGSKPSDEKGDKGDKDCKLGRRQVLQGGSKKIKMCKRIIEK